MARDGAALAAAPAPHLELDLEVRAALQRGDRAHAVQRTIEGLGDELRGYLHAATRDGSAAEELFAELGEQLVIGLPRFRGESSVRTYVYAIAWNLVRHHRRRARRERRHEPIDPEDPRWNAPGPRTPTSPHLRTTAKVRLDEVRALLTPEDRTLIVLRIDRGMPWSEIGTILGLGAAPAQTAVLRKRFERLVRRLRDLLRPQG